MPLQRLQQHLQQIYEVDVPHAVTDYLITDPILANCLAGRDNGCLRQEHLLVRQEDACLELSLYISQEIIERLVARNPTKVLDETNLADFCIALEGISHFVYLVWNATYDRSVSLFELELQAEIDKYITAVLLADHACDPVVHRHLHRRLFKTVAFSHELDAEEQRRYRTANHYADRYCMHLQERFLRTHQPEGMLRELRRYYRLPRLDKLRRIDSVR
ncbi:MAG: hypothetical protein DWQ09_16420 [Proteobacteria bacterium]|nr:MAG: hypothetical protein DWQ09_16420 [Pseudomonadota bacterium]QKK11708.1 MAG: hypothetical protein HND59_09025 [Pseudomonadota bacterium]